MLSATKKTMEIRVALHNAAFWLTTAHFTAIDLDKLVCSQKCAHH
jgi:hypothetical protein